MHSSVIENMKLKGQTYLGCVEGKEVFCNLKNEGSRKRCREYLESITGEKWGIIFDGDDYVFYRESIFRISDEYLECCVKGKVELPLKCTYTDYWFEELTFDSNLRIYTVNEYCETTFNNTFYRCTFSAGVEIDLSGINIVDVYGMFDSCVFEDGVKITMNSDNITVCNHMFNRCKFKGCIDFVFDTTKFEKYNSVFYSCRIGESISTSTLTTRDIIKSLSKPKGGLKKWILM